MSEIKISELNPIPTVPTGDDFFPLVDSGSMTTYRTTIAALAFALTSSQQVSGSKFSSGSLFASSSVSASHALISDNVTLYGYSGNVPYWSGSATFINDTGINGNLGYSSPLFISFSVLAWPGIVGVGGAPALDGSPVTPDPVNHPYFSYGSGFRYQANTPDANGGFGVGGINTPWPIISQFVGTDQVIFQVGTSAGGTQTNMVWSGSANSGSYVTLTPGLGNLSQVFNGKWVRVVCTSGFAYNGTSSVISMNAAKGEIGQGRGGGIGLFGRIKFIARTSLFPASATEQIIDLNIHDQWYGGGISANVDQASTFGKDIIKTIRASIWSPPTASAADPTHAPGGSGSRDPMVAIDVFIDDLVPEDDALHIACYSWGGIKFLNEVNVDPPPLRDTGSWGTVTPQDATYLMIPVEPGFYTSLDRVARNYNLHGLPVTIQPHRNIHTGSAWDNPIYRNPYSLNVYGPVNSTTQFYCDDTAGQSGTIVGYDPTTSVWKSMVYKGGILVNSASSVTSPVGAADTVGIGTIMAYGGIVPPNNWMECDGTVLLTASYQNLYTAIGNTDALSAYGYLCNQFGVRDSSGYYFKLPDLRGEFLRGWDHGRGVDAGRESSSFQACAIQPHKHIAPLGSQGRGPFGEQASNDFLGFSGTDGNNSMFLTNDATSYNGLNPNNIGTIVANDTRPRNVSVVYIIKYSNAINFANTGSTLAGDVTGNIGATTVVGLRGVSLDSTAPTDGQAIIYNGTTNKWTPTTLPTAGGGGGSGKSFIVANPGLAFGSADGNSIYVLNFNRNTERRHVVNLNMTTNAVSYVCTASLDNWKWYGRLFKHVASASLGSPYHGYFFTDGGLYDFDVSNNNMKQVAGSGAGLYYDLPVSVSFAAASGSRPTIWALYGNVNAGTYGFYPFVRFRKHFWNGVAWTYEWASNTVNLRQIQNATEFLKFHNDSPTPNENGAYLIMWDYNFIKKRYYIIDSASGYLHILSQSTGTMMSNWNESSITYEKTLAIPSVDSTDWSDSDAERMTIDYDLDTGEERGIIYIRRSNQNLLGVVNYVAWPE